MIYTIGYAKHYDAGLEQAADTGIPMLKKGAVADYPGGIAVKTVEDGLRAIREHPEIGSGKGYAVYEVYANWEADTKPSRHGFLVWPPAGRPRSKKGGGGPAEHTGHVGGEGGTRPRHVDRCPHGGA